MTETVKPQRYKIKFLKGQTLERWPVSVQPNDGEMVLVDRGDYGTASCSSAAIYRDGHWWANSRKPLDYEPTYWTRILDDAA